MDNKFDKIRINLVIAISVILIAGFIMINLIMATPEILVSERRVPARFPTLSAKNIVSAEFMDKFENYAADTFPLRDNLRFIRSATIYGAFLQTDKNGLYFNAGGAGEYKRMDMDSIEQTAERIKTISDSLDAVNIYYSFVPDRSIYESKKMPGFNPILAEQILTGSLDSNEYTFINLTDVINTDSFFRTDLHWNQVNITDVLEELGAVMGFEPDLNQYTKEYAGEFQGGYVGQIALPIGTDSLHYFSCPPSINAKYLNSTTLQMEDGPIYNWDKFSGLDAYDFFLSGIQPIVILENEDTTSDKELYIFRDSFASALAPLMASAYSKVVLIDLRFIDMWRLNQLIEFKAESDALFLYSSRILNDSDVLLVR